SAARVPAGAKGGVGSACGARPLTWVSGVVLTEASPLKVTTEEPTFCPKKRMLRCRVRGAVGAGWDGSWDEAQPRRIRPAKEVRMPGAYARPARRFHRLASASTAAQAGDFTSTGCELTCRECSTYRCQTESRAEIRPASSV